MGDWVWAKSCVGWNMSIAQLWGSGPVMTVVCGSCGGSFRRRIVVANYPVVVCPCGTANKLRLAVTRG